MVVLEVLIALGLQLVDIVLAVNSYTQFYNYIAAWAVQVTTH